MIDGELRQDELVADLLFDCETLVSYLSQGTTLQKGSVIMTGTPGGECHVARLSEIFTPCYLTHMKQELEETCSRRAGYGQEPRWRCVFRASGR